MTPINRRRGAPLMRCALLLAVTHGCDSREADPRAAADDDGLAARAAAPADSAAVVPFETGNDFPLPFRTTVPAGSRAEIERPDGAFAGAVRFTGTQPGTAFLRLVVLPEAADANDARGLVLSIATDFGVIGSQGLEYQEATPPPGHPWAITGYRLRGIVEGKKADGWLSLGEQDGRFFYVMALAPEQVDARLASTWHRILADWTWTGGGRAVPLASTRP